MILVVGATGLLGGMITRQLLAQRKEVRILARENSPSEELAKQGLATPAQSLINLGASPISGDLKEPASLAAACQGVDTVITTANSVLRSGDDNLETVDRLGTKSLIDAAQAAGIRHFIYTSVHHEEYFDQIPLLPIKHECEKYLKASGLDYTILRPAVFMEIWIGAVVGAPLRIQQPVTLIGEGKRKNDFVSMADVAAYAAVVVDNPAALNQTIEIGGPESYSWTEAVQAVGRAVGQELPVNYVPPGEPLPLLEMWATGGVTLMETSSDSFIDMSETSANYGVAPTSLDTAMQRMFGGAS